MKKIMQLLIFSLLAMNVLANDLCFDIMGTRSNQVTGNLKLFDAQTFIYDTAQVHMLVGGEIKQGRASARSTFGILRKHEGKIIADLQAKSGGLRAMIGDTISFTINESRVNLGTQAQGTIIAGGRPGLANTNRNNIGSAKFEVAECRVDELTL